MYLQISYDFAKKDDFANLWESFVDTNVLKLVVENNNKYSDDLNWRVLTFPYELMIFAFIVSICEMQNSDANFNNTDRMN